MPTPTKTQWIGYPLLSGTCTTTHVRLPNNAEAGDTFIIAGQFGSGSDVISAIADDQGGSLAGGQWVKDKIAANAGNGQSVCILRRSSVPANTRAATITFSGATGFSQFAGLLLNNITGTSPVDVSNSSNPVGVSLASGKMLTAAANDFYVMVAAETAGTAVSAPTRFTADANSSLWGHDPLAEFSCMYGVATAAATVNPTVTLSRSVTSSVAAAVAYKTATAGGTPGTGVEVRHVQMVNFNCPGKHPTLGTTLTFDVPCQSGVNALAFAFDDGSGIFQASSGPNTSSSPVTSWTATAATQAGNPATGAYTGFVYAQNATVSPTGSMTLKVTNAPTDTGFPFEVVIWAIANAGTVVDATRSGANTNNTIPPSTQNSVLSTSLTTSQANSLILFYNQEERQTITTITASTGTALALMPDNGVYESLDSAHDAGIAHLYASSATSYNFNISWQAYQGALSVGPWCAQAIAFAPVAAAGGASALLLLLGNLQGGGEMSALSGNFQ